MVAYNFQPQFVDAIRRGEKSSTIRRDNRRHARVGERAQLYAGQRTPFCEKIIDDPVVSTTFKVCLILDPLRFRMFQQIDDLSPNELYSGEISYIAESEGFSGPHEMCAFFRERYKQPFFVGRLIRWQAPVTAIPFRSHRQEGLF